MKNIILGIIISLCTCMLSAKAQTVIIADFESDAIGTTYDVYAQHYATDGTAEVTADPAQSSQKSLLVEAANYDVRAKFTVTLPEGKTLADYSDLKFDTYWTLSGDARYKEMVIYIDETKFVRTGYELQGETSVWTAHNYSLSELAADLKGLSSFELQIGINLESGSYYLDNIRLSDESGSGGGDGGGDEPTNYYIIDFDTTFPTAQQIVNNSGATVSSGSTVVEAAPGRSGNALLTTLGGYEQNLQLSLSLPQGKSLVDYESFEIDIYYGTSGDNYHKDVKYSVNSGSKTKIDATGDNLGVWKTLIIPVNVSGGNTFTFEIGYHANSGANFYLDNFKMKEKTGSGGGGGGGDIGESSVFEDFESKNINDAYDMKRWYPEDGSAIVGADPADSNGKSVHILTSNWDAFLKMNIALPSGKTLSDYETFSFDIYIVNNSDDEYPNYKNMAIYLDDEKKYEESDYPGQAEIATWTTKIYSLSDWSLSNEEMGKSSFSLAFGLSTDHGDYYIDNVALTEKGGGSVFIPSVRASNIIDWSKADYIQVYNIGGQLLNSNLSSVSALSDGCYILKAQIEGQRAIGKIIISK